MGSAVEEMVGEEERLSGLISAAIVKIPAGQEGFKAVRTLRERAIPTVVTLCFSPLQALLTDKGVDGIDVLEQMRAILVRYGLPTMVLAASIRSPMHVLRAALIGIDAITVPHGVFAAMARHPLTDAGLQKFADYWKWYKGAGDGAVAGGRPQRKSGWPIKRPTLPPPAGTSMSRAKSRSPQTPARCLAPVRRRAGTAANTGSCPDGTGSCGKRRRSFDPSAPLPQVQGPAWMA